MPYPGCQPDRWPGWWVPPPSSPGRSRAGRWQHPPPLYRPGHSGYSGYPEWRLESNCRHSLDGHSCYSLTSENQCSYWVALELLGTHWYCPYYPLPPQLLVFTGVTPCTWHWAGGLGNHLQTWTVYVSPLSQAKHWKYRRQQANILIWNLDGVAPLVTHHTPANSNTFLRRESLVGLVWFGRIG